MTVKDIRVREEAGQVVLSAMCKVRKVGWDTIYFSVDASKREYVMEDASAFAAALLIPSMKLGEDLVIQGAMSQKLHKGMQQVMKEILTWDIGLRPINVVVDQLVPDTHKAEKTASFFSGGVDSFYTFLKHREDADPRNRVDSLLLVKGIDIDPRNTELWDATYANIDEIATEAGVELVVVQTNLHGLLKPIILWDWSHGGALAGFGLFLRKAFHKIYIPSTFSVEEQLPWGSHMDLDKHWSTESLTFDHDGTEATRLDKVMWQVAGSSLALGHLRVCYMNEKGRYNCGVCDKCVRTMIELHIAGVLDQASTFPGKLDLDRIRQAPVDRGKQKHIFHAEIQNIDALEKRNDPRDAELIAAIKDSMDVTLVNQHRLKGIAVRNYIRLERGIIYADFAYNRGRAYRLAAAAFGRHY